MRTKLRFAEAEERFCAFLSDNISFDRIAWVFREDLFLRRGCVEIPAVPPENEPRVEAWYEYGKRLGYGVQLMAFAKQQGQVFSYVYVPQSAIEAEYALMYDLKLSLRTPLLPVATVRGVARLFPQIPFSSPGSPYYEWAREIPSHEEVDRLVGIGAI